MFVKSYIEVVSQAIFIQWVLILIAIWFHYCLMSFLIVSFLINKAVFQISSSLIVNIFWCFHIDTLWWKVSSFIAPVIPFRRWKDRDGKKYSIFPWDINGLRAFILSNWDIVLLYAQFPATWLTQSKFLAVWKLIKFNSH